MIGAGAKFFSYFRKPTSAPCSRFAAEFLKEHPEIPVQAAAFLILSAYRVFYGDLPSRKDLHSFFALFPEPRNEDKQSGDIPENLQEHLDDPRTLSAIQSRLTSFTTEERAEWFRLLSELAPAPNEPAPSAFFRLASNFGVQEDRIKEILKEIRKVRLERQRVLTSGAGIAVALAVIGIFLLAATFLKVVFFGFILAYFFLPLEKFFERSFFRNRRINRILAVLTFPLRAVFLPGIRLRQKLYPSAASAAHTPDRRANQLRARLTLHASLATLITIGFVLMLFFGIILSFLLPAAFRAGADIHDWADKNEVIRRLEKLVTGLIPNHHEAKTPETAPAESASPANPDAKPRPLILTLRQDIRNYLETNQLNAADLAFSKGKDILSLLIALTGKLGTFLFDILLCIFFFFYFLQKMALYAPADPESGTGTLPDGRANRSVGEWAVHLIFSSSWLPAAGPTAQKEAAEIIDRIARMFKAWVRGYFSIILAETSLYSVCFLFFSVPYALLLAGLAGCTILLPFIGPLLSIVLTLTICVVFLDSHLLFTLIGVALTYLFINGILEQLFLYPKLVGGSIGLTTLETIIVVLIGGICAGIPGMIFAVPAAAVIKYLIPKIYRAWIPENI